MERVIIVRAVFTDFPLNGDIGDLGGVGGGSDPGLARGKAVASAK